jgi:hypothetical protein
MAGIVEGRLRKPQEWVDDHSYKAYYPFNQLTPRIRQLSFGNLFAEILLERANRQSTINLLPLLSLKLYVSTIEIE